MVKANQSHNLIGNEDKNISINLFGEVSISYNGENILNQFIKQEREFMVLLIVYSYVIPYYFKRNTEGVNNQVLTNTIWPNISAKELKNRKGVILNRIRSKLKKYDWIQIVFNNNAHKLVFDKLIEYDFITFCLLYGSIHQDRKIASEIFKVLNYGSFLEGTSYKWMDSIQMKLNLQIIDILTDYVQDKTQKNEDKQKAAELLLYYDPINIFAITELVSIYKQKKQMTAAKLIFDQFISNYLNQVDEPHNLIFSNI